MRLVLLAALALLLAACTSEGGDASTPTPTPETSATATIEGFTPLSEVRATLANPSEPTPQPSLEELYRPRPYAVVLGSSNVPAPLTLIPPPNLEAANAEGPLWVGEHRFDKPLPDAFERAPGSADLECVEVRDQPVMRSGDWLIDLSEWSEPGQRLGFLPAAAGTNRHELILRATRLDEPRRSHVYVSPYLLDGEDADGWSRPTFALPEAGRWVLVVASGPLWGCFVLDAPGPNAASLLGSPLNPAEAESEAPEFPWSDQDHPSADARFDSSPSFEPDFGIYGFEQYGTAERTCVEVPAGMREVRAGDWLIMGLSQFDSWSPFQPGAKILWQPLHPEPPARLWVRGTLLDAPEHTYTFQIRNTRFAHTGVNEEDVQQNRGFPTGFRLPRAGTWMLVVTSDVDWGCVIVDAPSRR